MRNRTEQGIGKRRRLAPKRRTPPHHEVPAPHRGREKRFGAFSALAVLGAFFLVVFTVLAGFPAPSGGEASQEALVDRYAHEFGVDSALVHAVIECESGGRPGAVSRAGALGLMQVMPATASVVSEGLGLPAPSREDLFDPEINIRIGTCYLSRMLDLFRDDHLALGAYNAGPANVRRWMAQCRGADGALVIREAAFGETRHFVNRVFKVWKAQK